MSPDEIVYNVLRWALFGAFAHILIIRPVLLTWADMRSKRGAMSATVRPLPVHSDRRRAFEPGDLAECVAVEGIEWAVEGPKDGEVRLVEMVREEDVLSQDGQSVETQLGLKFERWPYFYNARWFRRIELRPDHADRADPNFTTLMRVVAAVVRSRGAGAAKSKGE